MKTIMERLRERLLGQDQHFRSAVDDYPFGPCHEAELLRERINREDGLLNSRTSIFLLLNGLAAVAVADLATATNCCWLASLVAVVVNLLWFYCSRQCLKVLAAVTRCYLKVAKDDPVEELVQKVLGSHHFWRPNTILGVYLPGLAVVSWLAVFLATSPWPFCLGMMALVMGFTAREAWYILRGEAGARHEKEPTDDGISGTP